MRVFVRLRAHSPIALPLLDPLPNIPAVPQMQPRSTLRERTCERLRRARVRVRFEGPRRLFGPLCVKGVTDIVHFVECD